MAVLADEGWLCASRRHIGGAGDILAIGYLAQPMLIEVKSTARSAWVSFGPADRQALIDTAIRYGAEPMLFWWPPRGDLQRIPASEFPSARADTQLRIET